MRHSSVYATATALLSATELALAMMSPALAAQIIL
jgi:hypothetical protein